MVKCSFFFENVYAMVNKLNNDFQLYDIDVL